MKPLGGCEASDDREAFLGDQCNVWTVSNGNLLQIVRLHILGVWQNPGVHVYEGNLKKPFTIRCYSMHIRNPSCVSANNWHSQGETTKTRYGMARPLRATLIFCWCLVMSKSFNRIFSCSLLNLRAKGLSGKKHLPGYIYVYMYIIYTHTHEFLSIYPFPNMSDFTQNFPKKNPRISESCVHMAATAPWRSMRNVESCGVLTPKETTGDFFPIFFHAQFFFHAKVTRFDWCGIMISTYFMRGTFQITGLIFLSYPFNIIPQLKV